MENNARKYDVYIYDSGTQDTPTAEIHTEIHGNFETFYKDFLSCLAAFHQVWAYTEKPGLLIRDGAYEEDIFVTCSEFECILSLLYCLEDHDVTVREILYQGNRYTDISEVRFSSGFDYDDVSCYGEDPKRANIRLHAKKNGCGMRIYLFGPSFHYLEDDDGISCLRIYHYPRSCGMVEAKDRKPLYYAGTYVYDCFEDEGYRGYSEHCEGVEVFLETEDDDVTFSVLLDGRLHEKIKKDDDYVIFYSALHQGSLLNDRSIINEGGSRQPCFWECIQKKANTWDIIFRKNGDGRYLYIGGEWNFVKRGSGEIIPPKLPAAGFIDEETAGRLCRDYMDIFTGRKEAEFEESIKIWQAFHTFLTGVHARYGLTGEQKAELMDGIEYYKPAEIIYAASQFFSLEEEELAGFLTTARLQEKYEMIRGTLENFLNYKKDEHITFDRLKEAFAANFALMDQFTYREEKPIPDLHGDVTAGGTPEEQAILLMVSVAWASMDEHRMIRSTIKYYQTEKAGNAATKERTETGKGIDEVIAMKKRLIRQLKESVKGQDMAVEKFVDGYMRYQLRGKAPGKPAGLYLFAGPPGTGKTYLAETFSKLSSVVKEGYRYKRFDMSAYGGGSNHVTGLVGFERTWREAVPGQLTDFVRKNPKCVLLFDEIEKAGPPVRMLFLSVLEGARLTDRFYDEEVSFEDAILIFTTNEGKELYEDNRGTNLTALPDSAVIDGLAASDFAPELVSRFMSGTVVMFNHVGYTHMADMFKASVDAALGQIGSAWSLPLVPEYDDQDRLAKLYLLSKGDRIDARYVNANGRKTAEDYFLEALEWMAKHYPGKLHRLRGVSVLVEVTDEVREYFERPEAEKLRLLVYTEGQAQLSVGEADFPCGLLPQNKPEPLGQMADCIRAGISKRAATRKAISA